MDATARHWGTSDETEIAVQLTSELVTNAIVHAPCGSLVVCVTLDDEHLRVTVLDGSSRLPQVRDTMPSEGSGGGLRLVDALATSWGIDAVRGGKAVWFELAPGRHGGRVALG